MKVGFTDPHGPRFWRIAPYVLPTLLFLLAIYGPLSAYGSSLLALAGAVSFNLLGLAPIRQRKLRQAEIVPGPGYIDVRGAGTRNQRIRAKDISGGTTARTANGLLITLQHRSREQPITFEVANDAEAEKIRLALGIGHGGFGTVGWRTLKDGEQHAATVGRILAVVAGVLTTFAAIFGSADTAAGFGVLFGMFGIVGAIIGLVGLFGKPSNQTILMGAQGLQLRTPRGWFALPYEGVLDIYNHARGFVFTVPPPWNSVAVERMGSALGGMSVNDRRVLVEQVNAAAQRARGLGPQKTDVTGRVDVLRRNGEAPRDWLVRLDMAGQMLGSAAGAGYRGSNLDAEDLWAILEDPEAEPSMRAAAARVLRHAPGDEVRVRIDAAVAATRDDAANKRLRIAINDNLDEASNELAVLDATEYQEQQQPQRMVYGR